MTQDQQTHGDRGAGHHRRLERMYLSAPCNQGLGLEVEFGNGEARIQMPVQEGQFHTAGAVHGSYLFKLLDDAGFFACNSLVTDEFVLTASFGLYLLRPVSAGTLHATGTVIKPGKTLLFAEAVILDDAGREIARGSGTYARSGRALTPELGYV